MLWLNRIFYLSSISAKAKDKTDDTTIFIPEVIYFNPNKVFILAPDEAVCFLSSIKGDNLKNLQIPENINEQYIVELYSK